MIFLIAANKGKAWEDSWTTNFSFYVVVDLFVSPFVAWGVKIAFTKYKSKLFSTISKFDDERFVSTFVNSFFSCYNPQNNPKQVSKIYPEDKANAKKLLKVYDMESEKSPIMEQEVPINAETKEIGQYNFQDKIEINSTPLFKNEDNPLPENDAIEN